MSADSANKKFEDLTLDVWFKFNSLGTYINENFKFYYEEDTPGEEIQSEMSPSELVMKNVLRNYLHLAERFLEQFHDTLKTAYEQETDGNASDNGLSDADVTMLMQEALDKLIVEWENVYGFIAATKMTSEGQKSMTQSLPTMTELLPLIKAASRDVGLSIEYVPVIPQIGTVYSLGFFNYTDDFLPLNLPITALKSPWEWTVIWHELAGQKVRLLKKGWREFHHGIRETLIGMKEVREFQYHQNPDQQQETPEEFEETFKHNVRMLLEWYLASAVPGPQLNALMDNQPSNYSNFLKILTQCVYDDYMSSQNPSDLSLDKTSRFIHNLSPAMDSYPILMFSFENLLDDLLDEIQLPQKGLIQETLRDAHRVALKMKKSRNDKKWADEFITRLTPAWKEAFSREETLDAQRMALLEDGWSADWLEELFEDSCSVLNFDVDFLPVFDRLLQGHAEGGKDMRHPPHAVRLAAAAVLKLMDLDATLMEQKPLQADDFPAHLNSESLRILKKYYPGALSSETQKVVWLAAKKFHAMHKRMKSPQDDSDTSLQKVKDAITNAMKSWMNNPDTLDAVDGLLQKVLNTLKETDSYEMSIPSSRKVSNRAFRYSPKIDILLNGSDRSARLSHRELLDLSFSDVDFGVETYTNIRWKGANGENKRLSSAKLSGPPITVSNGPVVYLNSKNKELHTNISNWNDKAKSAYKLK